MKRQCVSFLIVVPYPRQTFYWIKHKIGAQKDLTLVTDWFNHLPLTTLSIHTIFLGTPQLT